MRDKEFVVLPLLAAAVFVLCLSIPDAQATSYKATQSGYWNDPATWGGSSPPITIKSGDSVTVPTGITVTIICGLPVTNEAGGLISNGGTIDNQCSILNYGLISNHGPGRLSSPPGVITNEVASGFENYPGATLTNYGTINFDESGTISYDGTTNSYTGSFRSEGTFNVEAGSTMSIGGNTNFDIIAGTLAIPSQVTFVLNSGSTLTVNSGTSISNAGTLVNNGAIRHIFPSASFSNTGTFTNAGVIDLDGTLPASLNLNSLPYLATTYSVASGDTLTVKPTYTLQIPSGYTLDNGGTLTNEAGAAIFNYGTIYNYFAIGNYGTISNLPGSILNNWSTATFINYSGASTSNAGTIGNLQTSFANIGSFTNTGTFTNNDGSTVDNNGTFTNSGTISTDNGSGIISDAGGTISNVGTMNNGYYIIVNAGGVITNSAGGILNNNLGSTLDISGTFTNNGSIVSDATILIRPGGSLINNGAIASFHSYLDPNSGRIESEGSLSNSGSITDYCGATFYGNVSGYAVVNACNPTATVVSPGQASLVVPGTKNYTATVTDTSASPSTPGGIITWTDGGSGGKFNPVTCNLLSVNISSGMCSTIYTAPTSAGGITVKASYGGENTHAASSGTATLNVFRATNATVLPSKASVTIGMPKTIHYRVNVTDFSPAGTKSAPAGTVVWTDGGKGGMFTVNGTSTTSCTLSAFNSSASACTVSYTPSKTAAAGTIKIIANYTGDPTHSKSSGQSSLTVMKRTAKTVITPNPSSVVHSQITNFTATVTDTSAGAAAAPTGTISWTSSMPGGSFASKTCSLIPVNGSTSTCTISYTGPAATGSLTITGKYSGDKVHKASAGTSQLTVT